METESYGRVYQAPWGKILRWSSAALVVLAVGMVACVSFLPAGMPDWAGPSTRLAGVAIVLGCLPFMILGYSITDDAILIKRLLWTTRLERRGLKSAEVIPHAMKKSLRTFGNGGGFSFTGWYWNKPLGSYRAFVTDLEKTVVLRFQGRTVVVSPSDPQAFVNELSA